MLSECDGCYEAYSFIAILMLQPQTYTLLLLLFSQPGWVWVELLLSAFCLWVSGYGSAATGVSSRYSGNDVGGVQV